MEDIAKTMLRKVGKKIKEGALINTTGGCATPEIQRKRLEKNKDVEKIEKIINVIVDDKK